MPARIKLEFHPATPDRWPDVECLFGQRGACGGCWCMSWRLSRSEFARNKGENNRRALQGIIQSGDEPGVLAYHAGQPIGWCAIAPREVYVTLERSRIFRPIEEHPPCAVWSISCLFIAKAYRRKGISSKLILAAVKHARRHGAKFVEAYPVTPYTDKMPDAFAWTGLVSCYEKAGFKVAAQRSKTRPMMRRKA